MSDWRSKPRNGRAEFLKHEVFIQARIEAGATYKAIYQCLKDNEEIELSLSQFNRYISKLAAQSDKALLPKTPVQAAKKSAVETLPTNIPPTNTSQKNPLTHQDLRRIRRDVDNIDLNALKQGKGVVFRKEAD